MRTHSPPLLQISDVSQEISPRSTASPRNTVARYNTRVESLKSFQETINITDKTKKKKVKT